MKLTVVEFKISYPFFEIFSYQIDVLATEEGIENLI